MTDIAFHFNVPDKLAYSCRLLRKAYTSGMQVVVTGEAAQLARLDDLMWTFSTVDFLPHTRVAPALLAGNAVSGTEINDAEAGLGILLAEKPERVRSHGVLVNLGQQIPDSFERFDRFIELVTSEADDRLAARRRWKHYADRGYALVSHDQAEAANQS